MSKLLEQINTERKTKRLGDLVFINQSSIMNGFPYNEIEYIDTASVTQNHFDRPQILNINEAPSRAKRLLKDGDTILSTVRPSLCHYGFIKKPKPNTVASTGFVVLTPKNINPFYLYSYLTQDSITDTLSSIAEATTTTFPAFRPEFLSGIEIEIPDLPIQNKIAEILSAYDSKIENNNKIIKNLEAIAQVIFKEWFINFRFPGYEKAKFVESEMGEIPEGWEVKKISEFCEAYGGSTPSTKNVEFWEGGDISWVTPTDMTLLSSIFINRTKNKITKSGLQNSSTRMLPENTILMTSRATVGVLAISKIPITTNQGFISCVCRKVEDTAFMFWWLKTNVQMIKHLATGSTFPEISRGVFREINIFVPSDKVRLNFHKAVMPLHDLIYNLYVENFQLKQSRDQLLAKLI